MKGQIYEFDARNGGVFLMSLTYNDEDHSSTGKTSEHTDVVQGRFLNLVPDEQIVQLIEFESNDPMFAGEMTMTWTFAIVQDGTEVTIVYENVPKEYDKNITP
ncbi:SRPBCC domain-containing protein [Paenibacillus solani]|uniref:SRPBCC domain-containing protein n=1 Tax=Paenibacillus solani TaxID=1705565 RepID=UPI003D2B3FEC